MDSSQLNERYRQAALVFAAIIGGVIVTSLFFLLVYQIRGALPPFIYALVIVYILRPLVNFMVDRNIPRIAAVSTVYLLILLILAVAVFFLVPALIKQVTQLIVDFPKFLKAGIEYVSELKIAINLPPGTERLVEALEERARVTALGVASGLPETTIGFFGGIFNIIISLIIAFYVLKDLPVIEETIVGLLPVRYRDEIIHVLKEIDFAVGGYLRGQLLVALVIGVTIAAYLLAIGVNFAILLGMLAGLLNIIPYFGAIVGGSIAAIVAFFESPRLALMVVVGMLVIQQIEGTIVSPAIMRQTVNLHPVIVVLSLLVGGTLFGFIGLLLAIPTASVTKALFLHYVYARPVEIAEEG